MSQSRSNKRMKTSTHPLVLTDACMAPMPLTEYRYNASNVFARMQTDTLPALGLIFNRPHTFAILDRCTQGPTLPHNNQLTHLSPSILTSNHCLLSRPISRGHSLLVVNHPSATLLDDIPEDILTHTIKDLQV